MGKAKRKEPSTKAAHVSRGSSANNANVLFATQKSPHPVEVKPRRKSRQALSRRLRSCPRKASLRRDHRPFHSRTRINKQCLHKKLHIFLIFKKKTPRKQKEPGFFLFSIYKF
ncbi:hypothetical protein D7Z54_30645 [Salibacterium salarium]|uniref:Uncharacterized protein n=1 Tax=Salibacterium salarium TaxID=284579 RepID=A0A3R9P2F8_9BACI|nr:hypothetical protein D7Z54_30645 [Salibacterium salarium]